MPSSNPWWARLLARLTSRLPPAPISHSPSSHLDLPSSARVLVVLEGLNDIEFFRRASTLLHAADPQIPDLAGMERQGELVFIPFGGGELGPWAFRLAGLGRPEFHLYDRETSPETEAREQIARIVNLRPGCRAFLTSKRNLENYLDPRAIFEASGIEVEFSDHDPVADLVARQVHERAGNEPPWEELPPRARKRRRAKAKTWLNTRAVERMTLTRLAERDPEGEVRLWLVTIAELAAGSR